jgi:hypothetical protein
MVKNLHKIVLNFTCKVNIKQVFTLLLLSFFIVNAEGQTKERKWNLGILGGFNVYAGDLGNSMTNFTIDAIAQNPIGGITFSRFLSPSFNISVMSTIGSFGYYKDNVTIFKGNMLHGNIHLKYKLNNNILIKEEAWLAPFIFAGVGASDLTGPRINSGLDFPTIVTGIGARLRINEVLSFTYQSLPTIIHKLQQQHLQVTTCLWRILLV